MAYVWGVLAAAILLTTFILVLGVYDGVTDPGDDPPRLIWFAVTYVVAGGGLSVRWLYGRRHWGRGRRRRQRRLLLDGMGVKHIVVGIAACALVCIAIGASLGETNMPPPLTNYYDEEPLRWPPPKP